MMPVVFLRRGGCAAVAAVLLLLCAAQTSSQHAVVFGETGPGAYCNCVVLSQCPALAPEVGQRITHRQASIIQAHGCGFVDRSIKVCCPAEITTPTTPTPTTPTPTTPTPTTPTTPTPTTPTAPPPPTRLPEQCGHSSVSDRIIGGTDAELGAHPWMVAIGYSGGARSPPGSSRRAEVDFKCGGSLVTSQHVVTAAHCVHPAELLGYSVEQLNIGDWNLGVDPDCQVRGNNRRVCAPPVTVREAGNIAWHPQYNSNGFYNNDIAVIRLDRPVTFGAFIQPICIPRSFDPRIPNPENHPSALATGWGDISNVFGTSSTILQQVRLPFADIAACNATFRGVLTDKQICAGGEQGRDTCRGDSGGPLITTGRTGPPHLLVGLTSFGRSLCGTSKDKAIYSSVSEYRSWIEETLSL